MTYVDTWISNKNKKTQKQKDPKMQVMYKKTKGYKYFEEQIETCVGEPGPQDFNDGGLLSLCHY